MLQVHLLLLQHLRKEDSFWIIFRNKLAFDPKFLKRTNHSVRFFTAKFRFLDFEVTWKTAPTVATATF